MSDTARSPFAEPAQSPGPPEHPAPPPPAGATPAPVRRLHPFTLLLQMAALLPQFLYIIPALFFGMYQGGKMAFIAPALLVFFLLSIGFSWLAWHRFTYQVGAEELRITSGIMNRNARSIPYARIQDVSIEQKLLARLLGLATVKLETGSGGGDDGVLNAVSLTEAGRLRDIIRARKSDAAPAPGDAAVESPGAVPAGEPEPAPLFAMDSRRVLIAGIFNFSLVILAVLIAAAQNLDFLIPQEMFDPGYWIDRIDASGRIRTLSLWSQVAGLLGAIVSLVFVGLATGIVRTYFREYGFRLDRTDNGLRRRRGLATLTDVAMPLHRIQAASVITGPVKRRFGWYQLKFQSLASDGKNENDHSVAPLASLDEIDRILAEPGIARQPGDTPFRHVERSYWRVPALMAATIVCSAAALAALADVRLLWLALLALPLAALFYLRWTHHRYVLADRQLFVRTGFWRQRLTILPVRKVQSADLSQSLLARKLGHSSLVIGVAGGSGLLPLTIHALPETEAAELRRQLLRPVT